MNETIANDRSRIVATAKSLGDAAPDRHSFTDKSVLLTAEPQVLTKENGRDCFLNCFRLLIRMVTRLTVHVPDGSPVLPALLLECERISHTARPTIVMDYNVDPAQFDAILSVGTQGCGDLPWTVVNSNGWVARVSSCGENLPEEIDQSNPIGALAAACLGVSEVFKRLVLLRPKRGGLLPATSFSFLNYCKSDHPGPQLPANIPLDAVLIGVGAIGNGIVHLLDRLQVSGKLTIVDFQNIQSENWGTYLLLGPESFNKSKVQWAQDILKSKMTIVPQHCKVEAYVAECGKSVPFPRFVVNALDNIPARRAVQALWPDQIIDGAIGPTSCEVTLHPWPGDLSCLLCDFEEPAAPARQIQLAATGLRADRLDQPDSPITAEDVATAPSERRQWLQQQIGKSVCSVVSEGVLSELSSREHPNGFAPSAPFVACLSACMVVAELVRHVMGWPAALATGFQFDALVGPANGVFKRHARKSDCMCVTRMANIEQWRAKRPARP
jgi:hypothetical protein